MQVFSQGSGQNLRPQSQCRRPSVRRKALLMFCVLGVSLCAAFAFGAFGALPHAHAATWTQVWDAQFNGANGTGLNTSDWKYDTGQGIFGTGEIETMTNSTANVYQDGQGHLVIKALRDANGNWTSGRIETQRSDFAAPAGGEFAMQATIQQPNLSGAAALGYWPAFWSLGSAIRTGGTWPGVGEIDMMEDVNGLSSVYGTLHCGVDPGGPCNETTGIGSGQRACSGCQTGFHTYRVEVDRSVSPEQIRWYLDGVNYFTVHANQVDPTTWANAVDHSFFIIFDLAMGGGFPNGVSGITTPTSSTQSGGSLNVSDVSVYTANGNVTPTPTAGGSTPTPTSSGCSGNFTQGVNSVNTTQAQFWFQPCGWTAGYVIVHYTVPGQTQQNVTMSYNSGANQWQYTAGGLSPGQTITYSFTYQQNGAQYDTGSYTWTVSSSATPTPTPTPVGCSGNFNQGVNNAGSNQAQFWFQPCGWTAGYVIIHYTVPGQTPQNVTMSYNSGANQWQYTAGGVSPGQTITYSFTYQQNGLQYDTGSYTWTHP